MTSSDVTIKEMRRAYSLGIALVVLLLLVSSFAWTWFAFAPAPLSPPQMTIDGVESQTGGFCPGDVLTYTYTVTIARPGVYIFDASVWSIEPHRIVIFNDLLRMTAARATAIHIVRNWPIPADIYDTLTDSSVAWRPGEYERHIAITSSGRDTLPSIATIPFIIRQDCVPGDPK